MSSTRVRLTFPSELVQRAVISEVVRDYGVIINIRRADVKEDMGWMVCEIEGAQESLTAALTRIEQIGIDVDRLDHPLES